MSKRPAFAVWLRLSKITVVLNMDLSWLSDPAAWLGLLTLILLELVLGIDNLIFVALIAEKLPPERRKVGRSIGLGLALFMRLGLLAGMAWLVTLTAPLFEVFGHAFSGRDLIMIGGGLFLLYKATKELHERIEGADQDHSSAGTKVYASFASVVAQIVLIDLVFSVDSIVTAIGMTNQLELMMIAVVFTVIVMMFASTPLANFVNRHPSVVILCLGFLLMIGLSLMADGFGLHVPKAYLYAAIGFSMVVETFNQIAAAKQKAARAATPGSGVNAHSSLAEYVGEAPRLSNSMNLSAALQKLRLTGYEAALVCDATDQVVGAVSLTELERKAGQPVAPNT